MKTDESTTVLLWTTPEERAEREMQEQARQYQMDAIAEAQAAELTDQLNKHWRQQ